MARACLGESVAEEHFKRVGVDPFLQRQITRIPLDEIGIATSPEDLPSAPISYGITQAENGEPSFTCWRESSSARRLADDPVALTAVCSRKDLIYFSRPTLAILDTDGRKTLLDSEVRKEGARVAFNPNYRSRF